MSAYRNGTGGGPDVDVAGLAISKLYKRVLSLTGITAAVGSRCPCPLKIQLERQQQQQVAPQLERQQQQQIAPQLERQQQVAPPIVPDADLLLNQFIQGNIPNNDNLHLQFEVGVGEAEIHGNALDEEEVGAVSLDIPVNVKTVEKLQVVWFEKDSSPTVINHSDTPDSVAYHVQKGKIFRTEISSELRRTLKLNLEVLLKVMQSALLLE